MQVIQTKFIPCANVKGARIKAYCARGSITIDYPDELNREERHKAAADALVAKFVKEDEKKYGTTNNPWLKPRVQGTLKDETCVHVYLEPEQTISEVEETRRGQVIADMLHLKKDVGFVDRYPTTVGNKTSLGLFRLIQRFVLNGK